MAEQSNSTELDFSFDDDVIDNPSPMPFPPKSTNSRKRTYEQSKAPFDLRMPAQKSANTVQLFSIEDPSVHANRLKYIKGIQSISPHAKTVQIKCVTKYVKDDSPSFSDFDALHLVFNQTKLKYKTYSALLTSSVPDEKANDIKLIIKFKKMQQVRTSIWVENALAHHKKLKISINPRIVYDKAFITDRMADFIWVPKAANFIREIANAPLRKTRQENAPTMAPTTAVFTSTAFSYFFNDNSYYNALANFEGATDGVLTFIDPTHGKVFKTGSGFKFVSKNNALLEYVQNIINKPLPLRYSATYNNQPVSILIANDIATIGESSYIASSNGSNVFSFNTKKTGFYFWCRSKLAICITMAVLDNVDTINCYAGSTVSLQYIYDRLGYRVVDPKCLELTVKIPDQTVMRSWYCSTKASIKNKYILSLHKPPPFLYKHEIKYVLDHICPSKSDFHIQNFAHPHQLHSNHHSWKFTAQNMARNLLCGVDIADLDDITKTYQNIILASNCAIINGKVITVVETYKDDHIAKTVMSLHKKLRCDYGPSLYCKNRNKCEYFSSKLEAAKLAKKYQMTQEQVEPKTIAHIVSNIRRAAIIPRCGHLKSKCKGCSINMAQLEDGYTGQFGLGNAPNEQTLILVYHSYGISQIEGIQTKNANVVWDNLSTMAQLGLTFNKDIKQRLKDNDLAHLAFHGAITVNADGTKLILNENRLKLLLLKQEHGIDVCSDFKLISEYSVHIDADQKNNSNTNISINTSFVELDKDSDNPDNKISDISANNNNAKEMEMDADFNEDDELKQNDPNTSPQ